MRVLYLIDSLGTGGTERSLVELLRPLALLGVEPTIATLVSGGRLESEVRADGYPVIGVGGGHAGRSISGIARTIRRLQPLVVHTSLFNADILGRISAVGSKAAVLTSLVNSSYEPVRLLDPNVRRSRLQAARLVDGWTARHLTDHFHAVSRAVKDSAVRHLHLKPDSITIVERGRDPVRLGDPSSERRMRARAQLALDPDAEVIVSVGRHEFQKDHECLVAAVARLSGRQRLVALIAGRNGNATDSIVDASRRAGLEGRVRLLGHRDDVPDVLAAADVLVCSSRFEGMPGAVIEGMALGLPIVATDIPPVLEVVEPGVNAVVFPPGDSSALARSMSEVLDDGALRQRMGSRSRQIFLDRFTLSSSAQRMLRLYEDLLGDRAPGRVNREN